MTGAALLSLSGTATVAAAPAAPGAVRPAPSGPAPAVAGTAEPGEPREGGELPMGGSLNARLPGGDSISRWTFEAPGPGVLKVAVGGNEDLTIAVATPEGVEAMPGWSDQDLEQPWTERLEVPLFSAGTYVLFVEAPYEVADGGRYHVAAGFVPGEPQPSETLYAYDIEAMRSLSEPGILGPEKEATGAVAGSGEPGWIRVHRVEAAPGLYAVTSSSDGDLDLSATSIEGPGMISLDDIPVVLDFGDSQSDNDFGGNLGAEAVVVGVAEGAPAWVAVRTTTGEPAAYRLRLSPIGLPDAPAGE